MWSLYEPFADRNFLSEFARQTDQRFWEMYLAYWLLEAGKNLVVRMSAEGPDILIEENDQRIWIEAISPTFGDVSNPNSVPDTVDACRQGIMAKTPKTQIELRVTAAVKEKRDKFRGYLKNGIVSKTDVKLIAIGGSAAFQQVPDNRLPYAFSAVYPIEGLAFSVPSLDNPTSATIGVNCKHIPKVGGRSVPRSAFLSPEYSDVSGIIWSSDWIGRFSDKKQSFTYIPNSTASLSLPAKWAKWASEYMISGEEGDLQVSRLV
ncbi:hypothetical protein EBB79_14710 [Parasedimentitalea marina]|uniref:Uncharacterized protein n=2 Tax=Parasedimentitalea marina TaxID=2483033 RepID=A0A3T0N4Q5_9RHOB|nr:hypothetical protein EBB79_14710 [Parasedimentitalea marina]